LGCGLSPGTKYWFAVKAYNAASGYGAVSNSPNATTVAQGISILLILLITGGIAATLVVIIVAVIYAKKKKH
jgi:hypothetical protein